MSQNDELLMSKGIKVISSKERKELRAYWQKVTWEDMKKSLSMYKKYAMLRPTGFGKTYTCACAANRLCPEGKKVIFVYKSDILKKTFEEYEKGINGKAKLINKEVVYETYTMIGQKWGKQEYLDEIFDNVGLIIFDEMQYMGAETYRKALDFALQYAGHTIMSDNDDELDTVEAKYNIPYIGATATVERRDVDVCDKYFTHKTNDGYVMCWGENIFTLNDAFESGLIIPPEYVYIETNKGLLDDIRHTRKSLLDELKIERAQDGDAVLLKNMQELSNCVIKNADKLVHDSMLDLYMCDNKYKNLEKLPTFNGNVESAGNLPKYMRFLVFTPNRDIMDTFRLESLTLDTFEGMVNETAQFFRNAFGRYGYKVRTLIISSRNEVERKNVNLIDPDTELEAHLIKDKHKRIYTEQSIVRKDDMVIDLIFSINMLNVGYHVDSITGIVLRRWTGSNQIYYQQLGRCLSVDSDKIPIVFDFVNSISSKGINAPLYAVDSNTKAITVNADGTEELSYKGRKNRKERKNDLLGNVNPRNINVISTHYINVYADSATVEEMLSRYRVYETRKNSREIFEKAYKLYAETYVIENGRLVSNPNRCTSFLMQFYTLVEGINKKEGLLTVNYKAYVEYLAKHEYTLFITYDAILSYIEIKKQNREVKKNDYGYYGYEDVNSALAMSNKKNSKHAKLMILVNSNNVAKYREDVTIHKMADKYDIIGTAVYQI